MKQPRKSSYGYLKIGYPLLISDTLRRKLSQATGFSCFIIGYALRSQFSPPSLTSSSEIRHALRDFSLSAVPAGWMPGRIDCDG